MRYSRATTTTTEMVVVSDVPPVTKEAIAAIARMVVNEAIVGTVCLTDTEFNCISIWRLPCWCRLRDSVPTRR